MLTSSPLNHAAARTSRHVMLFATVENTAYSRKLGDKYANFRISYPSPGDSCSGIAGELFIRKRIHHRFSPTGPGLFRDYVRCAFIEIT